MKIEYALLLLVFLPLLWGILRGQLRLGLRGMSTCGLAAEVLDLLRGGNKIQAIKVVRDATGLGLKEAKDYVESLPGGR